MIYGSTHKNYSAAVMVALLVLRQLPAQEAKTSVAIDLSADDRTFFQQLVHKIQPDLVGDASRLDQYVWFYQQELANDVRLFAFQVTATASASASNDLKSIRLNGYVEFAEHRAGIANMLRVLGFHILCNDIVLLPDEQLGERRYGFVTAAHSLSYDRPSSVRRVGTECLTGEPLFLLKRTGDYFLCHSGEGYLGYVAARDIRIVDEREFLSYLDGDRVLIRAAHHAGHRLLPAGARLKLIHRTNGAVNAQLPDGTAITLSASQCVTQTAANPTIEPIITAGQSFLGTKYLWGGKTHTGIDCSGLVQVAFGTSGLPLPRDSNQQVLVGSLSATRWCTSTMRRGDTMYFLGTRGRIRHTAIYLGDNLFLQAAMPAVKISSLDPQHPAYDAKRQASFAFAKRLM